MTWNSLQNCGFYNGCMEVHHIFIYLTIPLLLNIKVILRLCYNHSKMNILPLEYERREFVLLILVTSTPKKCPA